MAGKLLWVCGYCGSQILPDAELCGICGTNAARAWRLGQALGWKSRYLLAAKEVNRTPGARVQGMLLAALYRRIGKPGKALRDQLRIDLGHCIDAPEEIPAGACYGWDAEDEVGIELDNRALPMQLIVNREEQ